MLGTIALDYVPRLPAVARDFAAAQLGTIGEGKTLFLSFCAGDEIEGEESGCGGE